MSKNEVTIVKWLCDRCGARDEREVLVNPPNWGHATLQRSVTNAPVHYDLCGECVAKVFDVLGRRGTL